MRADSRRLAEISDLGEHLGQVAPYSFKAISWRLDLSLFNGSRCFELIQKRVSGRSHTGLAHLFLVLAGLEEGIDVRLVEVLRGVVRLHFSLVDGPSSLSLLRSIVLDA